MAFLRVQWGPFNSTFGDTELKFLRHVAVFGQSAQVLQLNKAREAKQRGAGWFPLDTQNNLAVITV